MSKKKPKQNSSPDYYVFSDICRMTTGEILGMHKQDQRGHWPWWRCNGGMVVAGGRPCAGCSAACAGSSPSTEGERPSAGTRHPRSPCWPEPSWTAATLAPSHRSPSPTETRTENREEVGLCGEKQKHRAVCYCGKSPGRLFIGFMCMMLRQCPLELKHQLINLSSCTDMRIFYFSLYYIPVN